MERDSMAPLLFDTKSTALVLIDLLTELKVAS
jgi:hypothetical protein